MPVRCRRGIRFSTSELPTAHCPLPTPAGLAPPRPLRLSFRALTLRAKDCAMIDPPNDGFRDRPVWLLGVAALVVAQAGLALALFGPGRAWSEVSDDRPSISSRHPAHLYPPT